jgi:hypothetical protein
MDRGSHHRWTGRHCHRDPPHLDRQAPTETQRRAAESAATITRRSPDGPTQRGPSSYLHRGIWAPKDDADSLHPSRIRVRAGTAFVECRIVRDARIRSPDATRRAARGVLSSAALPSTTTLPPAAAVRSAGIPPATVRPATVRPATLSSAVSPSSTVIAAASPASPAGSAPVVTSNIDTTHRR